MSRPPLRLVASNGRSTARVRLGAQSEALIEAHHALARAQCVAYVTRRPTPVRILAVGAGGKVTGHIERSPGVDYSGCLADGTAVYVEAKRCSGGTFPLSQIEPEQWDEMATVGRIAPLAHRLLVVHWLPDTAKGRALLGHRREALCVVPWGTVEGLRARGVPSLSSADLAVAATLEGQPYLLALRGGR